MPPAKKSPDKERPKRLQFPAPAHRFRIRWKDGKGEIVKHVRIDRMTLPPTVMDRPNAPLLGHHAELLDAQGTVLWRIAIPDLTDNTVELFERGGRMTRVKKRIEEQLLDVLVPEIPRSSKLVICRYSQQRNEKRRRAVVLQEFPVADAMRKEASDGSR